MISVILPAYNEEENIGPAVENLSAILDGEGIDFELLFVDDGSKDGTWQKILEERARDSRVTGISFSRNFGKEAAMFAGLEKAKGRI